MPKPKIPTTYSMNTYKADPYKEDKVYADLSSCPLEKWKNLSGNKQINGQINKRVGCLTNPEQIRTTFAFILYSLFPNITQDSISLLSVTLKCDS